MQKRSKLSKHRQELAAEYVDLARMLARFFVQSRPAWQKSVLIPDLEGEGFLALSRAARTYDKRKLPYPKAYFARAIMNGMYKWIKKQARQPADWKISLQEAEDLLPILESPDYLNLAIDDLPGDERDLARDRFQGGHTLRTIAENHQISLRSASVRSRQLARNLASALDIRLSPHAQEDRCRSHDTNRKNPADERASDGRRGRMR
jgi:RNA polymerase sigma factor (sigma-70 family)